MSIIRTTAMCWWYNMDIFSYLTWNNSSLEEEQKRTLIFLDVVLEILKC